jgi:hypothetical protein
VNVAITDHAVERYLQRVRGVLDARPEIAGRVRRAWEAGATAPAGRGSIHVRDQHHDLGPAAAQRPHDRVQLPRQRRRVECPA